MNKKLMYMSIQDFSRSLFSFILLSLIKLFNFMCCIKNINFWIYFKLSIHCCNLQFNIMKAVKLCITALYIFNYFQGSQE